MATNWRVLYYETEDGQCPVREFIDSRGQRDQREDFLARHDEEKLKE